jgi:hypothetical protein
MAYQAVVLPVMIASPGDVSEARGVVRDVIHEWNCVNSPSTKAVLMPMGWETNLAPELGQRAQEQINKRLLGVCPRILAREGQIDARRVARKCVAMAFEATPVADFALKAIEPAILTENHSSHPFNRLGGPHRVVECCASGTPAPTPLELSEFRVARIVEIPALV